MGNYEVSDFHMMILNNIDEKPDTAIWKIKNIDSLSELEANKILSTLIEYACQPQNATLITIARNFINEISKKWLQIHFIDNATKCVSSDDEWEYRRLLELIKNVIPELLTCAIKMGLNSDNPEVVEAANDFLNI